MPGNLSITTENGRGVITYGVKQSTAYNMRYAFLTVVVVFVSCSVCASGDLEIYPGVNLEARPENNYDRSEERLPPLYVDRRRPKNLAWPEPEQEYFANAEGDAELKARISEGFRHIDELLATRRKQLKAKVEDSFRNFVVPDVPERDDDDFRRYSAGKDREFDRFKYPNRQMLDDVRLYPQGDNDFSFRDGDEEDEDVEFGGNDLGDNRPRSAERLSDEELTETTSFNAKVLDDPTMFAYAPPDPRFYEDSATPEIKKQREVYGFRNPDVAYDDQDPSAQSEQLTDGVSNVPNYGDGAELKLLNDGSVKMVAVKPDPGDTDATSVYIIAVVAGISAAATVGLVAFFIGWYNLQKHVKNASDVEYPAYGITGPNKEVSPSGDRRLAQSAQMYHYQHQKQQIIAMERAAGNDRHGSVSEADSDEENEEGDYTVYECPGLAPTGEMEVKNPLFQDDPTPAAPQTPAAKPSDDDVAHQK